MLVKSARSDLPWFVAALTRDSIQVAVYVCILCVIYLLKNTEDWEQALAKCSPWHTHKHITASHKVLNDK